MQLSATLTRVMNMNPLPHRLQVPTKTTKTILAGQCKIILKAVVDSTASCLKESHVQRDLATAGTYVPDMTPEAPSVRRKVMRGVLRVVLAVVVGVTVGPSITRGTLLREAVRRGASPPRHSPEWRSGPSDPLTSTPQGACLVSPTCQACLTTILLRLPRSRNRKLSKMCFATMSPIVRVC